MDVVSPLARIPAEVLEHIAFQVTCLHPLGPPSGLIPLLLTCKTVYNRLSDNSALYARIFRFKFDSSAVRRRAFNPTPAQYHDQLVLYCTQLQRLRQPVWRDCDEVLFSAYLMMLENDGRNAAQLVHAGLESYLDVFVRTRLWDERSHGWPTDNTANACALWLVWMTTTEEKLKAESPARRNQIIRLVLPYVLVPFRYASAFAPQHHFNMPLLQNAVATSRRETNSIVTAHGPYPIYLDPQRAWSQVHFASRPAMAPPLVTVAAKLIYFSRRETVPFSIPPNLPLNREAAVAAGIRDVRPTQEDIVEVNAHLNSRLPERLDAVWGRCDPPHPLSETWDSDWWRLRKCFDPYCAPDTRLGPCYVPGTFTGLWQGRMLIPSENHLNALISAEAYPRDFDEAHLGTTTFPLYMRITEHHSYAPDVPVPCNPAAEQWDDGMANAFFPPEARFVSHDGYRDASGRRRGQGVTVRTRVNGEDRAYEYVTYDPAKARDSEGNENHDPDTCPGCIFREERMRTRRAEAAAAAQDELIERMGMGCTSRRSSTKPTVEEEGDDADAAEDADADDTERDAPAHDPARIPPCTGIQDIIFTGATDLRHGQAWNHFEFHGRVRLWDGLVTLLRVSPDPRLGTLFFYGFVVGGHKFVGNWRVAGQDVGVPAYESAFSMARRDESD